MIDHYILLFIYRIPPRQTIPSAKCNKENQNINIPLQRVATEQVRVEADRRLPRTLEPVKEGKIFDGL